MLAEFNESFALNMEDVMFVEGLRHRQSAATAEVRMLLSKSSMQSSAIEERTKAIHEMLGVPKRRASQGETKAEPKHNTEVDEQLPMKVLKVSHQSSHQPLPPPARFSISSLGDQAVIAYLISGD